MYLVNNRIQNLHSVQGEHSISKDDTPSSHGVTVALDAIAATIFQSRAPQDCPSLGMLNEPEGGNMATEVPTENMFQILVEMTQVSPRIKERNAGFQTPTKSIPA